MKYKVTIEEILRKDFVVETSTNLPEAAVSRAFTKAYHKGTDSDMVLDYNDLYEVNIEAREVSILCADKKPQYGVEWNSSKGEYKLEKL